MRAGLQVLLVLARQMRLVQSCAGGTAAKKKKVCNGGDERGESEPGAAELAG